MLHTEEVTAVPDKRDIAKNDDRYNKYLLPGETVKNTLMLGFEYELYPLVAPLKAELFPTSFLKNSDGGFTYFHQQNVKGKCLEVRSSIGSLAFHKKETELFLQNQLNENDPGSENTGGIHVHIEKKNLLDYQINHVFQFLNDPENLIELYLISGRTPDTFKKWTRTQGTKEPKIVKDARFIINENTPFQTFEFRMFHSHPKYLMLALEMADSMWAWATWARRMQHGTSMLSYYNFLSSDSPLKAHIEEACMYNKREDIFG